MILTLSISHLPSLAYTLCKCKWLLLILSLFLTSLLIFRSRQNKSPTPLLIADYDYTYDTDDDDLISSTSQFEEEEEDDDDDEEEDRRDDYFRVRGSTNHERRRSIGDFLSLSEIANNKSVVKLWDTIGFGLGFGFDNDETSVVSVYDQGDIPNPPLLVSAGENDSRNLAVRVWDTRLRRRIPAMMAEWGPTLGKTVGVESGQVHKVCVKDNGRYGFTVGDMRNPSSPLQFVTDANLDLWWPNSLIMNI